MTDNRMKPYNPLPSSSLEFCQGYNAAVQKANEIIKSLDIKNTHLAEFLLEAEQENKALQVELQAKRSLADAYKKYYDNVLDEFVRRLKEDISWHRTEMYMNGLKGTPRTNEITYETVEEYIDNIKTEMIGEHQI